MRLTEGLIDAARNEMGWLNNLQYEILGRRGDESAKQAVARAVGREFAAEEYAELVDARSQPTRVRERRERRVKSDATLAVRPKAIDHMVIPFIAPPPRGVRVEVWCVGGERKADEHLGYAWMVHDGAEVIKLAWGSVVPQKGVLKPSAVLATLAAYSASSAYLRSLGLNLGRVDICTDNESAMNLMSGAWTPAAPHFLSLIGSAVASLDAADPAALTFHLKNREQSKPLREFVAAAHDMSSGDRRLDYALGEDLKLRAMAPGEETLGGGPVPRAYTVPGGG